MAFSSEVHRQRNQFRFATSSGRQIGYAYITTAVIPAIPLAGGFTNDPPIELEDINALTNTPTATFSSTLTAEKVKIKLSYIVGGSVTVTNVWDVAPDETSPGVHAMTFNTGESNADVQGWATTLHPLLGTQRVTITVSSDPELPTLYYGDKAADTLFYGGNEATAIYRGTTQIWPDVDTHIIDLDVVVTADTRPNVWDYVITWGVTGDSFTVGRFKMEFSTDGTTWMEDTPVYITNAASRRRNVDYANATNWIRIRPENADGSVVGGWATFDPT